MIDKDRSINEKFWWAIHNLIAHPMSEILYWLWMEKAGNWLHDITIPNESKHGRG